MKCLLVGIRKYNYKDSEKVDLHVLVDKPNNPELSGSECKTYKFVDKALCPETMPLHSTINIDLEEGFQGRVNVCGIEILQKGSEK